MDRLIAHIWIYLRDRMNGHPRKGMTMRRAITIGSPMQAYTWQAELPLRLLGSSNAILTEE